MVVEGMLREVDNCRVEEGRWTSRIQKLVLHLSQR